jgi:hypothetical protein
VKEAKKVMKEDSEGRKVVKEDSEEVSEKR